MFALLHSLAMFGVDLFKPQRRTEVENLFLRHQLSIALRRAPPRLRIRGSDRALLIWMIRRWPSLLTATRVVQPETILRWHRAGFTTFWRWKSRKRAGRPKIARELRDLIRRMSKENPKWGASRIHGEHANALKYWWCSPPKIGTGSMRPTVWVVRGISASLCSALGSLRSPIRSRVLADISVSWGLVSGKAPSEAAVAA